MVTGQAGGSTILTVQVRKMNLRMARRLLSR
jgi:hypothetical protein